jgi:membrane fusion protein, multidrug efflux system
MRSTDAVSPLHEVVPLRVHRAVHSWRRITVGAGVLVLSVAMLAIGGRWVQYRYGHVVSSDASLRGFVTKVGARINGQVTAIAVEESQRVAKGDVLARLDDSHPRAAVEQARAEWQRADAQLATERLAIEHERQRLTAELARAGADLRAAQADLLTAQTADDRSERDYRRLSGLSLVARTDLDHATTDVLTARAQLAAARAHRESTEILGREARIELDGLRVREAGLAILQSQVRVARAAVAAAKADLGATVLRAPDDGWVADRLVEAGASVQVGQPILSLWIGRRLWAEAWLEESQVQKIAVGNPATVRVDAVRDRVFAGHVEAIGVLTNTQLLGSPVPSTFDALIRTSAHIPVRIALDTFDGRLQPGLSVVVGIEKSGHTLSTPSPYASSAPPMRAAARECRRMSQLMSHGECRLATRRR